MESGLYIVTLNNNEPISANAHDPRRANKSIKVNKNNCKFGKAENFERRKKNYYKTFGKNNVNYKPVVAMVDYEIAEEKIKKELISYRIRGKTGRLNEWLQNIESEQVIRVMLKTLKELNLNYELLNP